jgi:orotate phosphoribosyltransferase
LLEQPQLTSQLCAEIARRFSDDDIECVIGPVTGGIILAFEVARHLGCRAFYAERKKDGNGFELRRGFKMRPGEKVLVVEDIVTTGGSVRQVVETVREAGAEVVGVALLVDRSGGNADFGANRVEPLLRMNIQSWAADEVPDEIVERYGEAVKPGSS